MLSQRQKTAASIGGAVVASVACAVALKRFISFKELKDEINSIPWDTKSVTWKDYFFGYKTNK